MKTGSDCFLSAKHPERDPLNKKNPTRTEKYILICNESGQSSAHLQTIHVSLNIIGLSRKCGATFSSTWGSTLALYSWMQWKPVKARLNKGTSTRLIYIQYSLLVLNR